jgi:PucR C-terminal helix-turn-helix domain
MQELLGRIAALDPTATHTLRVIACFDELIVGNVNTRGLLAAAAALAGCNAGLLQERPARLVRVTPKGEFCSDGVDGPDGHVLHATNGLTVWLERPGEHIVRPPGACTDHANDDMILERLALALGIRHGHTGQGHDTRRDLALLLDGSVSLDDRNEAATRLGLATTAAYRVIAAPLFAVWGSHPNGPEDVVPTAFGTLHAVVVPSQCTTVAANPSGVGIATRSDHLHQSFRTAVVALRLCSPPATTSVSADEYGGLIGLLADTPSDAHMPDVDLLDPVMSHPWACATLDALIRSGTLRQTARLAGVHHSTMQSRIDAITGMVGFDPLDGLGRTRLGIAYLVWRLRHSRVLDLPAPSVNLAAAGAP